MHGSHPEKSTFKIDPVASHQVSMSEIVGALSYSLDITEGQPEGHAIRSCMIGMRIGREVGLTDHELSSLYYALLLKDLGCSSNAAKVCYLFGADERTIKHGFKFTDWQSTLKSLPYIIRNVAPDAPLHERFAKFMAIAVKGTKASKDLVRIRCERGALIARDLDLPEDAVQAIRNLDEHWNGKGHPDGIRKHQIPRLARILSVAQTSEVFVTRYGLAAALQIVRERSGTWFDPDLVKAFVSIAKDTEFWLSVMTPDPRKYLASLEPKDLVITGDDALLDQVCKAFGLVIDAKSPWTACHSQGVSEVAVGIGREMGLPEFDLSRLRRAGLLHDIGKLGVSNTILDKPGKLTDDEFIALKRHPEYTHRILSRSVCFASFTDLAANHHEKLDGSGYHRGLDKSGLTIPDRILAVADMYEALAAKRPYRKDMSDGQVFDILDMNAGTKICAESVTALRAFLAKNTFTPYQLAA